MTRRSCCTRDARLRARVTAAAAGIAAGLLITPAALAAPNKRIVDGAEGQRVAAKHGGGAFKAETATNRSSTGLTQTRSANGTRSLNLEGRYQHVHFAVPDGAGGYAVGCTDDLATLRQATEGAQ